MSLAAIWSKKAGVVVVEVEEVVEVVSMPAEVLAEVLSSVTVEVSENRSEVLVTVEKKSRL